MNTVYDLLSKKGKQVWSVTSDTKVFDALKIMADKNVGALLVIDDGNVVGIFSERDYARKVVLKGFTSKEVDVASIMSTKVLYVTTERRVDECMALMIEKKVRHLPVFKDKELVGVISIGDVVNALLDHKNFMLDQLESYITGRS